MGLVFSGRTIKMCFTGIGHLTQVLQWTYLSRVQWTLITYILLLDHQRILLPVDISARLANNKSIVNGNSYYGNVLPLGEAYVARYFLHNILFWDWSTRLRSVPQREFLDSEYHQSLINHDYCETNPHNYVVYSSSCWGLTARDNPTGYNAQSPTNDNGTIHQQPR